jgi:MFS transporter, PPP family, 3-phenylpropionic acid transporter
MNPESLLSTRAARVTLVMSCLFAMNGVVLPFLPRWLELERHLDGAEIGLVLSLPLFLRMVIGPAIAFWADGCADRRTPLRWLTGAALVAYVVFFFIPRDFPGLVICGLAALGLMQGAFPLIEGALMRASQEGKLPYGAARGVASGAFVLGNVLGAAMIARFGEGAFAVWVLASCALALVSCWRALPADPAPPTARAATHVRFAGALQLFSNPRLLLTILGCGLIQGAHGFYYGFGTLVWRSQGVPDAQIGWLWACGTLTEIAFLWSLPLFERRSTPEGLIMLGGAGAALRWLLLGFAPAGFVLWPIQGLHALSFASAHVGAMRLLFREAPEESQALAQTLYAAFASGLMMGASTLLSGVLYDAFAHHERGYWAMAAMAVCGAGVAGVLMTLPQRPVAR